MRLRFFSIIFLVLTVVALGATLLHGFLLKKERLDLIDQQVRDTATALLDSEINGVRMLQFERIEEILSEELGETRIGKFFVIRDASGQEIFESTSAKLLPIPDIPRSPRWVTIEEKGKFIRILNLTLPRMPDRTLQVGVLVESSLLSPRYLSVTNLAFMGFIFLLGLGLAWGLTSSLLRPISRFVDHISNITKETSLSLPPIPMELVSLKKNAGKNDELSRLIDSFSELVNKVNRSYKLSRAWSYQMAHELKTPLAIMEGEIVQARRSGTIGQNTSDRLLDELMEASETVTAFLTWAELEGTSSQSNLYAVSAKNALVDIQKRVTGGLSLLKVEIQQDFYVLAAPQHFEHLLLNLIQNAFNYSPKDTSIEVVSLAPRTLTICDRGPGIPSLVIDRLGEPFNKGTSSGLKSSGHGLGLAYVFSVCRLNGWQLSISSTKEGTKVTVSFPESLTKDSH